MRLRHDASRPRGARLRYRCLEDDAELEAFAASHATHSSIWLPVDYLRRTRTVGAFDPTGRMVGGWVLGSRAPFRYLQALPADAACRRELVRLAEAGDLTEVTAVWLLFEGYTSRDSVFFWSRFTRDVVRNAARQVIFGYASDRAGLERLYARCSPRRLYQGPLVSSTSLTTHASGTLEMLPRRRFRTILITALPEVARRMVRARPRGGTLLPSH